MFQRGGGGRLGSGTSVVIVGVGVGVGRIVCRRNREDWKVEQIILIHSLFFKLCSQQLLHFGTADVDVDGDNDNDNDNDNDDGDDDDDNGFSDNVMAQIKRSNFLRKRFWDIQCFVAWNQTQILNQKWSPVVQCCNPSHAALLFRRI